MPSAFGHALFGSALGASFRARGALLSAAVLCAMAPDLDVLAFPLGVPYAAPLGHRGFTHSLAFAALLGAAAALALRALSTASGVRRSRAASHCSRSPRLRTASSTR